MEFITPALKELADQQVRFAPEVRRTEQLGRAAKLLGEIEEGRVYPYQYVCYRITDFRSDAYPELLIRGSDLQQDLAEFLRQIEQSIPPMPIEESIEPILMLDEVGKLWNVSTKTISRWRTRGLMGRRVLVNGRRQLGYPKSMLDRFASDNQELVERAARFSRLDDTERERILYRARRLAQAGADLTEVCRRIALRLNRSAEAIRYTIKNFDRDYPDRAIFPFLGNPLDFSTKEAIYEEHERGIPVETLTQKYDRSRSAIYQAINEVQARKLMDNPVEYIHHSSFEDPANEAEILADMPGESEFEEARRHMNVPKDVPADMIHLYRWPLLTKEQEQHLFRKMNYLKYKLNQVRHEVKPGGVRAGDVRALEDIQAEIRNVRDRLINCNTRLVASIAKRHTNQVDNLSELMSDGTVSMMRAVEKFDFSRGNKFSTYATWAIMKNFARTIPDELHHRERYMTGHEDVFESRADVRSDETDAMTRMETSRARINKLLEGLDPRTREVIRMRNGLDGSAEMTLEQIGQHFGITKERVRQINVRGMKQLRDVAEKNRIEL